MKDLLQEYQRLYTISKNRVLEECDEWTLYCFYLENNDLQLKTTYHSPIRSKDDSPSFSIYENTRSKKEVAYLWKDSALNKSGDIFELIKLMYSISELEVLEKINADFAILDDSKEVIASRIIQRPISKPDTRIRIKSKPLFSLEAQQFWSKYGITIPLLNWKQVKEVEYVWFNDEQEAPYKCTELTFAYPEYNKKYKTWHYQIYIPNSKDKSFKFRNCLRHNMLYGNNHLEFKTNTLIITKSNKDILVLKLLGYEAVAARSETTPVKTKHIEWYKTKYERLVILYDNDIPGKSAASQYNLPSIFIPEDSGCKDISDYIEKYGEHKTKELLEYLINQQ